jgi:hypothetical protein
VTDLERILKLLEDGKISKDQAEALLNALDAGGEAEETNLDGKFIQLERKRYPEVLKSEQEGVAAVLERLPVAEIISNHLLEASSNDALTPLPPFPPALSVDALAFELASQDFERNLPKGPTWVRVVSVSGDVTVRVEPELVSPVAEGEHGPLPITTPEDEAAKGKLTVVVLDEDLDLSLPLGYGVILDVKSGDVDIEECFVIGQVLSGDVRLESVSGVILTVLSGDVSGTLLITEGKHAIKVMSGDADIRLLSGSSVKVQGAVRSGTVTSKTVTSKNKSSNVGYISRNRLTAKIGKPERTGAHLDLSAMSGNLSLEVDDE